MSNAGQPTKFRWEYVDKAKEFLGKGHSLEAFAASIGVVSITVREWRVKYPEFGEAVEIGLGLRRKIVEEVLMNIAITGKGNAAAAIFLAKNWAEMNDSTPAEGNSTVVYKIVRGVETYEDAQQKSPTGATEVGKQVSLGDSSGGQG